MPPRLTPRKIFLVIIFFFFTTLLISRSNKSLWIGKREARQEEANRENGLEEDEKGNERFRIENILEVKISNNPNNNNINYYYHVIKAYLSSHFTFPVFFVQSCKC